MERTNFGNFRKTHLLGTNNLFNEFMRAFDLPVLRYMFNEGNMVGEEVRDYYEINEPGQKFLLNLKEGLAVFKEDYYAKKSAIDIAERINLDVDMVYPYVKNRTYSSDGYHKRPVDTKTPFNDFDKNSGVHYLSSFQILKDIQMDIRFETLKK
ncbi:hypothetical protein EV196_101734 [Mariniflexile fucanivorans]|uniref:Uncharacterized protein n=1 Tax=Mariniflexile fucanivorans TaxID=264023 RepID=A0A4R1RSF4_9FLAO|nr:hypothetical protein [Mariniflexile fucanivorans]TCL69296.1 hypothetical protein EV196_101734 [Mariniflexile fucanivorans]